MQFKAIFLLVTFSNCDKLHLEKIIVKGKQLLTCKLLYLHSILSVSHLNIFQHLARK